MASLDEMKMKLLWLYSRYALLAFLLLHLAYLLRELITGAPERPLTVALTSRRTSENYLAAQFIYPFPAMNVHKSRFIVVFHGNQTHRHE